MLLKSFVTFLASGLLLAGAGYLAAAEPVAKSPAAQQLAEAERLDTQAQNLVKQGKPREALPLLNKVLAIRQSALTEEHLGTAAAHNSLGLLLESLDDHAAAQRHYEAALKTIVKLKGNNDRSIAAIHHNLGTALRNQGDDAAARPHLEEALRLNIKANGEEHLDTATAHNGLAVLLASQGNLPEARVHIEKAWQIRQKLLGEQHPDTAQTQENLGAILQRLGNFEAARKHLEEVLVVQRKIMGEDHASLARFHQNLGTCLLSQGEYTLAATHLEQALRISQKAHGEDHIETAAIRKALGALLTNQGKYSAALPHVEQALRYDKKVLGADHAQTIDAQMDVAKIQAALAQWEVAGKLVDAARRSSQRHVSRELIYLPEKEQIAFLHANEEYFRDLALSLGLQRAQDPVMARLSADWLLNDKAIAQSALATRTLLLRDVDRTDRKNAELDSMLTELETIQQQLAASSVTASKSDQAGANQARLRDLARREGELSRRLVEKLGGAVQATPWVELDELRRALPADAVFIDIARVDRYNFRAKRKFEQWEPPEYAAWVIPAAGAGAVQVIPLGQAEPIDKAIGSVRKSIAAATAKGGLIEQRGERVAEQLAHRDLEDVAKMVWQPLVSAIGPARKLIISPDGALWLLPWGALPLAENKFLIEDYSLAYVVSGRDLLPKAAKKLPTTAAVVLADPDFDATAEKVLQALKSMPKLFPDLNFLKKVGQLSNVSSEQSSLPRVRRLPGTAAEANAIKDSLAKFAGQEPHIYMAGQALENVYKRVSRPKVTVLSTHGFFLADQGSNHSQTAEAGTRSLAGGPNSVAAENPLLRCGLLLGGCNSPHQAGMEDGILTGNEIIGLDLRGTELVVLSACETGVGEIRNGEGVAGLRQAFQLAGAEAVVATLWQVPDTDSAILVNEFFLNLAAGQSKTDALRNAQLKRIAARRDKYGAAHPYFWSAFTLTGT